MPGLDRTGPNGRGSQTGRGMGDCQAQETTRGGRGAGFGGRGMRMRNRFLAQNLQTDDNVAAESIDELYNQVEALKKQVAELTSRFAKTDPEKEQKV